MDSSAGQAQVDQNPLFQWNCTVVSKDGAKDVGLAVGEEGQDSLEHVGHVGFEGGEAPPVQFETARTGLL